MEESERVSRRQKIRRLARQESLNLRQKKYAPDFFGFVRALEESRPDLPRVGHAAHPSQENVRFGQPPFLHFPATEIAEIDEGGGDNAGTDTVDARVFVYFFGLLGVNGPLPLEFTNYILQRSLNNYDHTWRRFLDIIHHRFLTLYYRAYAQNEQALSFDRPDEDCFYRAVKALAGFDPSTKFPKKDDALAAGQARYFGFFSRNRDCLRALLGGVFHLPVEILDFARQRYDIPGRFRAILGRRSVCTLGRNCQIGTTYLSVTSCFDVVIGPISFDDYQKLMSGMFGLKLMARTINIYLDRPLDYNLIFKIKAATIPPARLGFDWEDKYGDAAQLGFSCWLGSSRGESDSAIAEFEINASRLRGADR
jgi:type VI secretion system protein ImpH